MKAFVTATGTEIGKTYVTCGLLRQLRLHGRETLALKPVLSGYDPAVAGSDSALLLQAQGRDPTPEAIAAISPWRFAAPLSPDMAAALEGRAIDYASVAGFCRAAVERAESLLIEGIGGVMVPLDGRHTVLDLMADLALPVVLVAGSYLGTLSHTLSALAVLRLRGVRGLVALSPTPGSTVDLAATARSIETHGSVPVVVLQRTAPPAHDAAFARIVRELG